ncbi:MAG: Ig-like domain-containing protein [Pseudomonadales bacterium]
MLITWSLASCLCLAACGGGGGSSSSANLAPGASAQQPAPGPAADTTAPAINSKAPDDQATGVATTTKVVVVFSESLQASSVDAQSLMVTEQAAPVAGTAAYDDSTNSLEFTPDSPLAADTVYGVTVASTLQDAAGNAFLGDNWFFTTGGPFNLGSTTQSTIDECMDDGDKLMLTLVNNARAADRSCGTQALTAQPPLAWNCRLDDAAVGHSTSMANNDFHAHVSPVDGSDPGDRIQAAGYVPQTWGENIAAGYPDEEAVMDGWLTSPGHCGNLMGSGFTEMGAGAAENATSTFGIYWTQNFGSPLN